MKKLISIIFYIFSSSLIHSQPIPDCAKNSVNNKLFIKSKINLFCNDLDNSSYLDSTTTCHVVPNFKIKDSLGNIFFELKFYKSISDFSDAHWKNKKVTMMKIYFNNLNSIDSINLYLEIPKFKEGTFFIDVSKKRKIKKVNCYMCKDSIEAIDITPKKWCKRKKWRT